MSCEKFLPASDQGATTMEKQNVEIRWSAAPYSYGFSALPSYHLVSLISSKVCCSLLCFLSFKGAMVFKNLMFRVQNAWNKLHWNKMAANVRRNFFCVEKVKIFYNVRKKKTCVLYINIWFFSRIPSRKSCQKFDPHCQNHPDSCQQYQVSASSLSVKTLKKTRRRIGSLLCINF